MAATYLALSLAALLLILAGVWRLRRKTQDIDIPVYDEYGSGPLYVLKGKK